MYAWRLLWFGDACYLPHLTQPTTRERERERERKRERERERESESESESGSGSGSGRESGRGRGRGREEREEGKLSCMQMHAAEATPGPGSDREVRRNGIHVDCVPRVHSHLAMGRVDCRSPPHTVSVPRAVAHTKTCKGARQSCTINNTKYEICNMCVHTHTCI